MEFKKFVAKMEGYYKNPTVLNSVARHLITRKLLKKMVAWHYADELVNNAKMYYLATGVNPDDHTPENQVKFIRRVGGERALNSAKEPEIVLPPRPTTELERKEAVNRALKAIL